MNNKKRGALPYEALVSVFFLLNLVFYPINKSYLHFIIPHETNGYFFFSAWVCISVFRYAKPRIRVKEINQKNVLAMILP